MNDTLQNARRMAADAAFEVYEFATVVLDSDGWASTVGPDERQPSDWTRNVYLYTGNPDSSKVTFIVRFKPNTAEVIVAFVSD